MFFGYAEHKTFVEYFGVTEFAKPQTKTCLGLSILIYPSVIQRLREGGVWREDGEDTAPSALSSLASPESLPPFQPLTAESSDWGWRATAVSWAKRRTRGSWTEDPYVHVKRYLWRILLASTLSLSPFPHQAPEWPLWLLSPGEGTLEVLLSSTQRTF